MDVKLIDAEVLQTVSKQKIITINSLSSLLNCSIKTARRRLKQWKAHTSYNHNGRFYTLPDIPQFDHNGLWLYQSVWFSRFGNLKQTILALIENSKAGLDAFELCDLTGVQIRSYLSALRKHEEIKRDKVHGRFVYFSPVEEKVVKQARNRAEMGRAIVLPKDTEAISILVETIKSPHLTEDDLSIRLRDIGCFVSAESIRNLFTYHDLTVKKTLEAPS